MNNKLKDKICKRCKNNKPICEFRFTISKVKKAKRYCDWCKKCESDYKKVWYIENREKVKQRTSEYGKIWRNKNKERQKKNILLWKKLNPEKYKQINKRFRENHRLDIKLILNNRMSAVMYKTLRVIKSGKRWELLAGYTVDELKHHLENKFVNGMSWDNIGKWHIDHIMPRASFHYTSYEDIEFRKCWALENLQPLWASENHKKWKNIL